MDEEEIKKKLQEIKDKEKTLALGTKEFKKELSLEKKEERELKKELNLEHKLQGEERKIGIMDIKSVRFFEGPHSKQFTWAFYIVMLAAIFIAAIMLRTTLAVKYTGFYEPDVFYHYSVVRAAVNNGFFVPATLGISGWPSHTLINEPRGLYWVTLLPYFFLRFVNVSYYTIMRYISLFYGLADIIGAYFLARFLSKDKFFLLLVMAMVALSAGNAARTSALIYRGDSFVSIFLMGALIFFVYIFQVKTQKQKILSAVLSGVSLSLTNFVWNGAPFVTIIYLISLVLVEMVAFIKDDQELMRNCAYLFISLLTWFIIISLFVATGQVVGGSEIFTAKSFAFLFMFLVLIWYFASYLMRQGLFRTRVFRFGLIVAASVLAILGLYIADTSVVTTIITNNGVIVNSAFAATIQELTPPSYDFLFASFNYALYTSPMSIAMTLPSVVLHGIPAISMLRTEMGLAFWILMLISFLPYLFMRVYDSGGGFLKGNARVRFGVDAGLIVLIVYFATTGFLQIYAIRFNSLVSVPLTIFGAYTIYWVILLFKKFRMVGFALVVIFLIVVANYDIQFSGGVAPADSMNNNFFAATAWLKNNTPASSVVLTLWPDGSVVEGIGNRTSVTDSVGSQNASKANPFAAWLFNSSSDPQFLTSNINGRPNYLLVRYIWLGETQGIYQESGLNASSQSNFAYVALSQITEYVNNSLETFKFGGAQGLNVFLQISPRNGSVESYIQEAQGVSPFSYVGFFNTDNSSFNIVKQTVFNVTNNQMLLVAYSRIPNPHLAVNVTGIYIMQGPLSQSNMIKFLYFCSNNQCLWNNNLATAQLVFSNSDTKIFKINYNKTAG